MSVWDPLSAARIGVHWQREFHFWRWREMQPGKYTYATDEVKRCNDAGMDVMMLVDWREPDWLKPRAIDAEGLPTEEALKRYADFVRDAVQHYPNVTVFEMQNEPDLELRSHRNLPLDEGVEFYCRLIERCAPIIREEAPDKPLAGCSVSGGDYRRGFAYSRPTLKRVGHLLDIFAPHPYAVQRPFPRLCRLLCAVADHRQGGAGH